MNGERAMASQTENDPFPTRLRKLMEKRGENQKALALELGVKQQTISYYRNGQSLPDATNLIKIARHYNVTVDYLLDLTDVMTPEIMLRSVCEYTGLSEGAITWFASLKSEPINTGGDLFRHLNMIIESNQFQYFMYHLHDLSSAVEAETICSLISKHIFSGDNFPLSRDECAAQEREFRSVLTAFIDQSTLPQQVKKYLNAQSTIFTSYTGNEEILELTEALIGGDGFEISSLFEYRANKDLIQLIEFITEYIKDSAENNNENRITSIISLERESHNKYRSNKSTRKERI